MTNGVEHISGNRASGVPYNLLGQPVGDGYKGVVIQNGQKYISR